MTLQEHQVTCAFCGTSWRDKHPDAPGALIWCGDCLRGRHAMFDDEAKPDAPEVVRLNKWQAQARIDNELDQQFLEEQP